MMAAEVEPVETVPISGPIRHLIAEVRDLVALGATLSEQIEAVVSIAGRVPLSLGVRSLSPWQRAAQRVLAGRSSLDQKALPGPLPREQLVLGMFISGRLALAPAERFEQSAIPFVFGPLAREDRERVDALCVELLAPEQPRLLEVEAFFAGLAAPEAGAMVQSVATRLDRVDPVLIHIGEETFSNVPEHNNLLKGRADRGGQYLLTELMRTPTQDWSGSARIFVACVFWLQAAGFRGEDFNGCQLSPAALDAFFDAKLAEFSLLVGNADVPSADASLPQKARALARLRLELNASYTFYRWIHGITLYKEQRLYRSATLSPLSAEALGAAAVGYLSQYDVLVARRPLDDIMLDFVGRVLTDPTPDALRGMHPIESLLFCLVSDVTESISSDFGMSRCIRRLVDLARVHDQDLAEEANAWPQSEYFCAVLPGAETRRAFQVSPGDTVDIMRAISARMRFNGWHYMPGHFSPERKTPERHVYNPPAMCDTAEWSDQRHRGHVAAEVRYSIRAPASLCYRNKIYPGFCDLRLMRRSGNPYTLEELQQATRQACVIASLFQAVLDVSVRTSHPFRIEAFSNQWFNDAPWDALLSAG